MSDTEVRNIDNGMSDEEESSVSEKILKSDEHRKVVSDSDSESEKNGFGADGEPDYKPRKDSSSSSSDSSDDEPEDVSKTSGSKSESISAEPPKPKSRSSSVNQSIEEPKESSDTEDESEELPDDKSAPVAAPVPVARKISLPSPQEEVELRASPEKEDVHEEFSREELELSKRETVHLEEEEEEKTKPPQEEDISEEEPEKSESEEEQVVEPAVEDRQTNGRSYHVNEESSSSSSDEEPETKEEVEEKIPSPRRSFQSPQAPKTPENQVGDRSPSPNVPKHQTNGGITKGYLAALNNNNNNNNNTSSHEHDPVSKSERPSKGVKDITQMYVAKTSTPPASPKPVARTKPAKDITQLYTGKIEQTSTSPSIADKISPKKHNMATAIDKDAIRRAYDDVRSDSSETEWGVFKFDGNSLGVTATGTDFSEFKSHFGNDDRGFGYIRIKTGDEMSKRSKFVLVTWVGPSVSVMKKAKMSTDKALMKDIIQTLSVELQLENHSEFNHDYFKTMVDKAAGARYGTGVRDL